MTRNEAKLKLFKVNRQIEKKIVEHMNELGQHNKRQVFAELQTLWIRKRILKNVINSLRNHLTNADKYGILKA